jgi:hypothetical protein
METKEIKGLPGMGEDDVVKIWKMNFGFKNDMAAETISFEVDGTGKRKASINPAKGKLATLVYGIYEFPKLNIPPIKDLAGGFSDAEKELRYRAIRVASQDLMEALTDEIHKLNSPVTEEELNSTKNG